MGSEGKKNNKSLFLRIKRLKQGRMEAHLEDLLRYHSLKVKSPRSLSSETLNS